MSGPTIDPSTATTDTPVLLLAPRINETGLQLRTAAGLRGLRAHTAASWRAPLPSAVVVDVGRTDHVLDVVLRSSGPAARLPVEDVPFLRELPEVVH
ncbi:hypothetical protein [Kitasatospora sp. NPDC094011]|uniref:hypothetical protein n=1 Tax=Kitasatospora sp. NPDC094011 TaxID=3364090 RepID=UPI0037F63FD4